MQIFIHSKLFLSELYRIVPLNSMQLFKNGFTNNFQKKIILLEFHEQGSIARKASISSNLSFLFFNYNPVINLYNSFSQQLSGMA